MPLSFLSLPAELRLHIYDYVFPDRGGIALTHYHNGLVGRGQVIAGSGATASSVMGPQFLGRSTNNSKLPNDEGILRTCHQLHGEAIHFLYADSSVIFSFWQVSMHSNYFRETFRPFPTHALSHIRAMEIILDGNVWPQIQGFEYVIYSLLECIPAVRKLRLVFNNGYVGVEWYEPHQTFLWSMIMQSRIPHSIAALNRLQHISIVESKPLGAKDLNVDSFIKAITLRNHWNINYEEKQIDIGLLSHSRPWLVRVLEWQLRRAA